MGLVLLKSQGTAISRCRSVKSRDENRATEKPWANYRSRCGARPFEIRNQLVFSARFSQDPESPGFDIEQKRESFVAVLGKEDHPGLGKKFTTRLTILDDREMVALCLDGEHGVLRAILPG